MNWDGDDYVPVQSEAEALKIFETRRPHLVQKGYEAAVAFCQDHGDVQAQDAFDYLVTNNLLTEREQQYNARWLAAIFKGKAYKGTWRKAGTRKRAGRARNIHGAPRTVWVFAGAPDLPDPKDTHITALEVENEMLRERVADLELQIANTPQPALALPPSPIIYGALDL